MSRPLRTLLVGAALIVVGALASSASAASFAYDNATHVLRLTGVTGDTVGLETTDAGSYGVSAQSAWTGDPTPGVIQSGPDLLGTYSLSIDSNTLPLERIEIVDDTGPVTASIAGGDDPYATPVWVGLNDPGSTARIDRSSGSPISFGTTWLSMSAPSIIIMNSITAADAIELTSTAPILLGNGGSEPTAKSLTATTRVKTSAMNANGKDLTVQGPWRTAGVSNAHDIHAVSGVTLQGDLGATGAIALGDLSVGPPAQSPLTITAPGIILQGSVHEQVGCADAEITCESLGAAGAPAGPGLVLDGAVNASGPWSAMGSIEVTGITHLGNDVSGVRTLVFDQVARLSGAATRTLQANEVVARDGITAEPGCGANSIGDMSACNSDTQSIPIRTANVVVDGAFTSKGTTYLAGNITVTGLSRVLVANSPTNASIQAGARLNLAGGLSVPFTGSALLSATSTVLAGMPLDAGAGSIDAAACDGGPVTVTGDLSITAPVECVGSLTTVLGNVTIGADVTSAWYQSYTGPTTIALGSGHIRLKSEGGALVNFPEGGVSASWDAAPGDIASYTAIAQPSGTSCTWASGPLSCALGAVPSASDIQFSVSSTPRAATTPPTSPPNPPTAADGTLPTGRTSRRTVARGSRTPLTRLIVPPASRGKRTWSETGPCTIRSGRLMAPTRAGTCKIALRVAKYRTTPAWTGRVTVTIK